MKIAFIIPSLKEGGPQLVVKTLVDELLKKGVIVEIFYFDSIVGINFTCPVKQITFWDYKKLKGFDIIHTHGLRPDCFGFIYKSFFKKTLLVSTIHSYIKTDLAYSKSPFISYIFTKVWNLALVRHDKIVTLSQNMKEYYSALLYNKKIDFVYNSTYVDTEYPNDISFDEFEKINLLRDKFTIIGNISFISELKGLPQIIDLLTINKNLAFLSIGDGPDRKKVENYAKEKAVEDRCVFVGFKKKPYRWLRFIDIYILSSYTEGFPLVLIESGYNKVPFISTNMPLFTEIFKNKEVELFEVGNIFELNQAVERIKSSYNHYSDSIYSTVTSCFSPEQLVINYLNIYKKGIYEKREFYF